MVDHWDVISCDDHTLHSGTLRMAQGAGSHFLIPSFSDTALKFLLNSLDKDAIYRYTFIDNDISLSMKEI